MKKVILTEEDVIRTEEINDSQYVIAIHKKIHEPLTQDPIFTITFHNPCCSIQDVINGKIIKLHKNITELISSIYNDYNVFVFNNCSEYLLFLADNLKIYASLVHQ